MKNNIIQVICGPGRGKTTAALGRGISALTQNKKTIMVQFLKGVLDGGAMDVLKKLEPDLKVFQFERSHGLFADLPKKQQEEELINLRNGFNYAKKVMATGECDILILDEVLGLVDQGIITREEFSAFLDFRYEETELIMTGRICPPGIEKYVDCMSRMENVTEA